MMSIEWLNFYLIISIIKLNNLHVISKISNPELFSMIKVSPLEIW